MREKSVVVANGMGEESGELNSQSACCAGFFFSLSLCPGSLEVASHLSGLSMRKKV